MSFPTALAATRLWFRQVDRYRPFVYGAFVVNTLAAHLWSTGPAAPTALWVAYAGWLAAAVAARWHFARLDARGRSARADRWRGAMLFGDVPAGALMLYLSGGPRWIGVGGLLFIVGLGGVSLPRRASALLAAWASAAYGAALWLENGGALGPLAGHAYPWMGVAAARVPAGALAVAWTTGTLILAGYSVLLGALVDLHRRAEAWHRTLVDSADDLIVALGPDGRVLHGNAAARAHGGPAPGPGAAAPPVTLGTLLAPADADAAAALQAAAADALGGRAGHAEVRPAGPDGAPGRAYSVQVTPLRGAAGALAIARDVSERVALEGALSHQAHHDPLTDLANRAGLARRVAGHQAERRGAGPPRLALLVVDLDGFKGVNDTFGHAAGDALLVEVAARLRNATRGSDTVARLGGDEFAVLLAGVRDARDATVVAERVVRALQAPIAAGGTAVVVGASVGVAVADSTAAPAPAQAAPAEEAPVLDALLRDADVALYAAKARGKGQYVLFTEAMRDAAQARVALEADLRRAVAALAHGDDGEFRVAYQPVLDMASGEVVAAEALVRWEHPTRGTLLPETFIDLAEATGLVVPLGRWVLGHACGQAAAWQRELGDRARQLGIAVNVAPRQLEDPDFVADVAAALAASGLAPGTLTLELTERAVVSSPAAAAERLAAVRALGVRVALDDFGAGHSALGYLRQFPVDVLKLDRSFVDGVAAGGPRAALAGSILALGASLGLRCVAEGVEDAAQRACLEALGCAEGQGFLFAHPLPPEELAERLGIGAAATARAAA